MNLFGLNQTARTLAFGALVGTMATAFAQDTPSKSLYERLGGIHKIAQFVDITVDNGMKDPMLLSSKNYAMSAAGFPAPAVKFFVTSYFASKTGGPQVYIGPNGAGVEKWFMFTPEQMDRDYTILSDAMKKCGCDQSAVDDFMKWWKDDVAQAAPVEPTPEMIDNKDSLYGRLGGIVPIAVVVDDFVNILATDKTVGSNPHTVAALTDGHVSAAGLKYLVTEQLAQATGGPYKYSGRTMADSHKDLNINEKEWAAGGKDLITALNKNHVPKKEQGEILAIITSTKGDIVKK
jgi:hemoglobin